MLAWLSRVHSLGGVELSSRWHNRLGSLSRASPRRWYSQQLTQEATPLAKIRNIGVVAHVDAGKTTTCERMLFYSGAISSMGDVDTGDTVMDFLKLERERGITIKAASTTLFWRGHRLNLIDTPGHVDFTIEVERSTRVLDGAVVVLDGVAGVQAQTETVWRQAERAGVARLAFVNKMDRPGASAARTLAALRTRLRAPAALLHLPLTAPSGDFIGVVDLVALERVTHSDPSSSSSSSSSSPADIARAIHREPCVRPGEVLPEELRAGREALVETVCGVDEALLEEALLAAEPAAMPAVRLRAAIRRATAAGRLVPVLLGASLRGRGVQLLLDAIVDFLPSPLDRHHGGVLAVTPAAGQLVFTLAQPACSSTSPPAASAEAGSLASCEEWREPAWVGCDPNGPLVALAFKVVHDAQRGLLTYLRLYRGRLRPGTTLLNARTGARERVTRLLELRADSLHELPLASAGNIAAALGLRLASTGDTLLDATLAAPTLHKLKQHSKPSPTVLGSTTPNKDAVLVRLPTLQVPPAVFMCAIEADSAKDSQELEDALALLHREDPSFQVSFDPETGQTLVRGMGELHLEIIADRLLNHYKVNARMGRMRIAYRSTILHSATASYTHNTPIAGKRGMASVEVEVTPGARNSGVQIEPLVGTEAEAGAAEAGVGSGPFEAVKAALLAGCERGVLYGLPLVDLRVRCRFHADPLDGPALPLAATRALLEACRQAQAVVLEPLMRVELRCAEEHMGTLLSDLTAGRRAAIHEVAADAEGTDRRVEALVPLRELIGYASALRSMTAGRASFAMEFSRYGNMSSPAQELILKEIRGF